MRLSSDMPSTGQELLAQGQEFQARLRRSYVTVLAALEEQKRLWREWRRPVFEYPGGECLGPYVTYKACNRAQQLPGYAWSLGEHLRQFASDQRSFREEHTRQSGFFVPFDLILPRKRCLKWDGFLGHLAGGTTVEGALEWAEWVSRGAPRCVHFWKGAFDRWCERGCARMHGTSSSPIGTITLKGRWRQCQWEEPSGQARSYVSVHDAVNRAAQRIQRFFLMAHATLMVTSPRGETIRPARQKDPFIMAFSIASQAVTADYEGRATDACLLYEMAVSDFNEVARELLPRQRGGSHDSPETWKYGRPLQRVRQQNEGYLHCFSQRVKELQPSVNAARTVRQANQERAQVLADLRGWEARYQEFQEAMSAREEQQRLRRAALKDQKRRRYRAAGPARKERKEQRRVQRGQLTSDLDGEWSVSEHGEAPGYTVFIRDLEVYDPGDVSPSLWFVEVDSGGFLVYVNGDDERVLARFDDDTLTWDDGAVYRRVCGANVEQVQEVTGSMEIDYATGVNDDVDDILGGVRAVFLGGAYGWHVEDDDFSAAHSGHASMARHLMSGGYVADNCGTRAWLYHHYEYIKGGNFSAGSLL